MTMNRLGSALLLVSLFLPVPAAAAVAAAATEGNGQFWDRLRNPKIDAKIHHNAEIGLDLDTVVFGEVRGECSGTIAAEVRRALIDAGVRVLNRADLGSIIGELEFGAGTAYANPEAASKIGEMYGASVYISIDVLRCETDQERKYRDVRSGDEIRRQHFSETQAFLKANVDVTDVATGQYLLAVGGDFDRLRRFESWEGYPEYPERNDVLDLSYRAAATKVRRALLPWTETREIIFYDDGECRMKEAHAAVKAGLNDRAVEIATDGLETCRQTPKMKSDKVARAFYNRGMMSMLFGKDGEALEFLRESKALKQGDIVDDAISVVQDRISTAREAEAQRAQAREEAERRAALAEEERRELEAKTLTNQKIIDLLPTGLPEELIIKMIEDQPAAFDVTPNGLAALNSAGVSSTIIMVMMERMSGQ